VPLQIDEMKQLTHNWPTMRMISWFGLFFLAFATYAADNVEDQVRGSMEKQLTERHRVLSLDDCIKIALEHNLNVQISQLDPELAGFSLKSSYAA